VAAVTGGKRNEGLWLLQKGFGFCAHSGRFFAGRDAFRTGLQFAGMPTILILPMSLIDRLEHRLGRYAIPGLIRYVVLGNVLVYILIKLNYGVAPFLTLDPDAILNHGEIWRLITYIFIPQLGGWLPDWLGAALYLYFLLWVGNGLEESMGSFRLNLYYFSGMLGITVGALVFGGSFGAALLNTSLLFAFASTYPDETIFVMYIIPAKIKWLAWLTGILLICAFLMIDRWSFRVSMILALANYFLFFGPEILQGAKVRAQVAERRRKFDAARVPDSATLHECSVCHRTEVSNPEMEFRVARDGEEYCKEHLPKPLVPPVGRGA
jgi:hypothetical protein